jgi:1,4-alpha-glucan branching enzyme
MAAVLQDPPGTGTMFTVWAPNARSVEVEGSFQGGMGRSTLVQRQDGCWEGMVAGARPGDTYRFVVNGSENRIDPEAREVTDADRAKGWGVIRPKVAAPAPFSMVPKNELVIYELHCGTFPDAPAPTRDLLSTTAADFWYLSELGVNAIEMLPTAEFPGDRSWGYNTSAFYAVESSYGGPSELGTLIAAAHDRGLAVILDVVYSHAAVENNILWQLDGWPADDPTRGGIYFYGEPRRRTPWGDRLDYGRPEVRRYLHDNALMWLDDYGADGLRFDATAYIRNIDGDGDPGADLPDGWGLLQTINDDKAARPTRKLTIAEDLRGYESITKRTRDGGAGFDAQWDIDFHHTLLGVLTCVRDEDRDLHAIRRIIEARYNGDAFQRVLFSESHDEAAYGNGKHRLPVSIDLKDPGSVYAKKRSTLGAALVLTAPGVPMIFQGQEILERRPFGDAQDNKVEWDNFCTKQGQTLGTCRSGCSVCEPNGVFRGIHQMYRDLIRLRRNALGNTAGLRGQHVNVFHVNHGDKVIAFHRWENGGPGDDVVAVLNFGNRAYPEYTLGLPRGGLWQVRFNGDWAGYDAAFGDQRVVSTDARAEAMDGLSWSGSVGLGAYSAIILSQDR